MNELGKERSMKDTVTVPAVERALDVMEYLAGSTSAKTLKALTEDLGIPSASLFRIIKNLVARGYVMQVSERPPKYVLGHKISQLSASYADKYTIGNIVKPFMEKLSKETNQTAQFAVRRGNEFIYIEQVLSAAPVNFIAHLYTSMAINTSAGAKCILAEMPVETQEVFLKGAVLERKTERTIVDKADMLEELRKTKERGYGMDNEEFNWGIGCIAAPVFGSDGECVGAVGITGSIDDYKDPVNFERLKGLVIGTGKAISKKVNG